MHRRWLCDVVVCQREKLGLTKRYMYMNDIADNIWTMLDNFQSIVNSLEFDWQNDAFATIFVK